MPQMIEPKISIIIPVFNREKYLEQCVSSILVQDYPNVEIILVDDGSTDKSALICDEYAKTYNFVKVIHKKSNEGVSAARNTGMDIMTGEYVLFLDSDDLLTTDALQSVRKEMTGIDILFFRWKTFVDSPELHNGRCSEALFEDTKICTVDNEDVRQKVLATDGMGSVCIKAFRAKVINQNNIRFDEDYKYAEDQLFMLSILPFVNKLKFINDVLYLYRREIKSLTSSFYEKKYNCLEQVIFGIERISEKWDIPNKELIIANRYFTIVMGDLLLLFNYDDVKEAQKKEYYNRIVQSKLFNKYIYMCQPDRIIHKAFCWALKVKWYYCIKLCCIIKGRIV